MMGIKLATWIKIYIIAIGFIVLCMSDKSKDIKEDQVPVSTSEWIAAVDGPVSYQGTDYYVDGAALYAREKTTDKVYSLSDSFSSDIRRNRNYLVLADQKLFYTEKDSDSFYICYTDTEEPGKRVIYTKEIDGGDTPGAWPEGGQIYLAGVCGSEIYYFADEDGAEALYAVNILGTGEPEVITTRNISYVSEARGKIIMVEGADNTRGRLVIKDREDGSERILSESCGIPNGNYAKGDDFYYLDCLDIDQKQFDLVCYDLSEGREKDRTDLPEGIWNAWKGCFYRTAPETLETELLLYDGSTIPMGKSQVWVFRCEDRYCFINDSLVVFYWDAGIKEWTEWFKLVDYGISFPYNQGYAFDLFQTDGGVMVRYMDEAYAIKPVFIDAVKMP